MAVRFKSFSNVRAVEERTTRVYVRGSGHGTEAKFSDVSIGWWIVCEGNVALGVGPHKPDVVVGQRVEISLTTVT